MPERDPFPAILKSGAPLGETHLHTFLELTGPVGNLEGVGDIRSFNWNGGSDLTSVDTVATAGFFWDSSAGSGQVMGNLWVSAIQDALVDADKSSAGYNQWFITGTTTKFGSLELATPSMNFSGSGNSDTEFRVTTERKDGSFDSALPTPGARLLTQGQNHTGHPFFNLSASGTLDSWAIVWDSDWDTYITADAADQLNFWAGGVEMLRLTESTTDIVTIGPGGGVGLQVDGNVGFYGTTPIAQQTGVAVTAAGIHAALVNLGLITA